MSLSLPRFQSSCHRSRTAPAALRVVGKVCKRCINTSQEPTCAREKRFNCIDNHTFDNMACPRNFISTTELSGSGGHPDIIFSNASNTPNNGLPEQMRCPYSVAGSGKAVDDRPPDPPKKMTCLRNSATTNNSAAAYTPAEAIELVCHAGEKKGTMPPDKIFLSAVSAGCLLSIGCAVTLSTMAAPWYQENAPGLIKMIGALVFPVGLMMIILTGADLFTASTMVRFSTMHL